MQLAIEIRKKYTAIYIFKISISILIPNIELLSYQKNTNFQNPISHITSYNPGACHPIVINASS